MTAYAPCTYSAVPASLANKTTRPAIVWPSDRARGSCPVVQLPKYGQLAQLEAGMSVNISEVSIGQHDVNYVQIVQALDSPLPRVIPPIQSQRAKDILERLVAEPLTLIQQHMPQLVIEVTEITRKITIFSEYYGSTCRFESVKSQLTPTLAAPLITSSPPSGLEDRCIKIDCWSSLYALAHARATLRTLPNSKLSPSHPGEVLVHLRGQLCASLYRDTSVYPATIMSIL